MTLYRAQVVLPYFTNLPEDVSTNTLYFDVVGDGTPVERAEYIAGRLEDFYGAIGTAGSSGYFSPIFAASGAHVKVYENNVEPPNVPIAIVPIAGVNENNSVSGIPEEVACVLSFHGAVTPGAPQARRRGRIYLGPLADDALSMANGSTFCALAPGLVSSVVSAATTYLLDMGDPDYTWSVYSQTQGTFTGVVGGWVDNSPDTQRRRGHEATSRTIWPTP